MNGWNRSNDVGLRLGPEGDKVRVRGSLRDERHDSARHSGEDTTSFDVMGGRSDDSRIRIGHTTNDKLQQHEQHDGYTPLQSNTLFGKKRGSHIQ